MKKFIFIFFVIDIALIYVTCSSEKPVYYAKNIIISNAPKYPNAEIILKEVSHFGGNQDSKPNDLLGDICGMDVDDEENLYVTDRINSCVKKFDKNGIFLTFIGSDKRGMGPGEFQDPREVIWDRQKVYVLDMNKNFILVFNEKGDFLYNIEAEIRPMNMAISNNKLYIAFNNLKQKKPIKVIDLDNKFRFSWLGFRCADSTLYAQGGNNPIVEEAADGGVYFAPLYPYEVAKYSKTGSLLFSFTRKAPFFHKAWLEEKSQYVQLHTPSRLLNLTYNKNTKQIFVLLYSENLKRSLIDVYNDQNKWIFTIDLKDLQTDLEIEYPFIRFLEFDKNDNLYIGVSDPYPHILKFIYTINYR